MKAIKVQFFFYLFFVLLSGACIVWGLQASGGERITYFVLSIIGFGGLVGTFLYERKHNLNQ